MIEYSPIDRGYTIELVCKSYYVAMVTKLKRFAGIFCFYRTDVFLLNRVNTSIPHKNILI